MLNNLSPLATCEFTGWDFEIANISSHEEIMDTEEAMLVSGFTRLKNANLIEVEVPTQPFPRWTFKTVKEKLAAAGVASEKDHDLSRRKEKLAAWSKKKLALIYFCI